MMLSKVGLDLAVEFFVWNRCNPLKSPESDEGIQENPRIFALDSLPFSLDLFGLAWSCLESFREQDATPSLRWPPTRHAHLADG
jgi:hypothetical protein